jgi:hypothetical protein
MSFPHRSWLHRAALIAALAGALSVTARSSLQDPAPQRPPTFRAGTDLVRVDVTVIDRRGDPVTTPRRRRRATTCASS